MTLMRAATHLQATLTRAVHPKKGRTRRDERGGSGSPPPADVAEPGAGGLVEQARALVGRVDSEARAALRLVGVARTRGGGGGGGGSGTGGGAGARAGAGTRGPKGGTYMRRRFMLECIAGG